MSHFLAVDTYRIIHEISKRPGGRFPPGLICGIRGSKIRFIFAGPVQNHTLPAKFRIRICSLQLQVGVGVQLVVLEDVAGLDGLHEPQVVGVDDSGGQTLHHSHGHQSGVHDGTDGLGCTVGVVGQTAGDRRREEGAR